jgi:chromosome segregation ATPase
VKAKNRVIKDI